jgi:murein tripeptide amidase MpaA
LNFLFNAFKFYFFFEGVDLNRNWDSHWQKVEGDEQTYSGAAPFSEPETVALKNALEKYQPFLFLTIHSGTMGMYTPYAYSDKKGQIILNFKFFKKSK